MDQLKDLNLYLDEWTKTQIEIWREKIERMGIVRSGALHQSFRDTVQHINAGGGIATITMRFARYGIYQSLGVGRGYARDNGGDLPFLDKQYRHEHGLDKPRRVGPAWGGYLTSGQPRKARDWYSKKLYMSTMAMVEDLARILGESTAQVVCDSLADTRSALS